MENAVAQVSRYLDRTGADLFTQNTAGILMCAICRSLRRYAMKLNRLELVGRSAELSERRIAPNWTALVDLRLDLERLSHHLTDTGRTMLGLRKSGFDWKEIAEVLQMRDIAAGAAFWREVKRAKLKAGETGRHKNRQVTARRGRGEEVEATRVREKLAPGKRSAAESADSVGQGQDFMQADGVAGERPNPRMR